MKKIFTACLLLSVAATAWAEKTAKVVCTSDGDYSASLSFYYDEESHESEGDVIFLEDYIAQGAVDESPVFHWDGWYANGLWHDGAFATATDCITSVIIDESFADYSLTTTGNMFEGFCNCQSIIGLNHLNTENVTSMVAMFSDCSSLTELDLSSFNTDNVTNMYAMFSGCSSLTELDLCNFDTEKVTFMDVMFCNCKSLTELNLSSFNTQNVQSMENMFDSCESLTELDLRSFDTKNVELMDYMFSYCYSLTTIYASSSFDISNVYNSEYMFSECYNLVGGNGTPFSYDHTDKAYAHIDSRFTPGYFTGEAEGVDPNAMFALAVQDEGVLTFYYKTAADLEKIQGTKFYPVECKEIEERYNGHWITIISWPWNGSEEDYWGSGDEDDYEEECAPVRSSAARNSSQPISHIVFDSSFKNFELPTLNNFFLYMFDCETITGLENLNLAQVTDMSNMFFGCRSLTELDLSSFDTSNIEEMDFMFGDCNSLTTIYASNQFVAPENYDMFMECYSLEGGEGTRYQGEDYTYAHIDGGELDPGYFTASEGSGDGEDAWAILDETTLTFYYKTRADMEELAGDNQLFKVQRRSWNDEYEPWSGVDNRPTITCVVIHESFADYQPTSTKCYFENLDRCTSIEGLENLNVANVKDMSYMFSNCSSLTTLDLSSFDTRNVTIMRGIFEDCTSLTTIYATEKFVAPYEEYDDNDPAARQYYYDGPSLFSGCINIVGGAGTTYNSSIYKYHLKWEERWERAYEKGHDEDYASVDGGTSAPGYFTGVFPATISDLGYSTLYLSYNAEIPEGVSVFAPTLSEDGTTLRLGQPLEDVIPAKTGVIIKGNADVYKFRQTTAAAAEVVSALDGTLEDMPASDITADGTKLYVLNKKNDNVGFYRYTGQTLGANKAYLAVPAGSAAPTRIAFEGEENALQSINNDAEATTVYNLQGQRVDQISRPGVYIINGTTSIIK